MAIVQFHQSNQLIYGIIEMPSHSYEVNSIHFAGTILWTPTIRHNILSCQDLLTLCFVFSCVWSGVTRLTIFYQASDITREMFYNKYSQSSFHLMRVQQKPGPGCVWPGLELMLQSLHSMFAETAQFLTLLCNCVINYYKQKIIFFCFLFFVKMNLFITYILNFYNYKFH